MALEKNIELDNGVIVNYHRIVSINKITNIKNLIEVGSYSNSEKRDEEKESLQSNEINYSLDIKIITDFIEAPYDDTMNIKESYEYLKTLEKYKGALDV